MSKKRLSMLDIFNEEREGAREEPPRAEPPRAEPPPEPPAAPAPLNAQPEEEPEAPAAKRGGRAATKSDYLHLSITVPPDLFERLQARSNLLRRARQPYTLSHLTREALAEWLDRVESEEDPS